VVGAVPNRFLPPSHFCPARRKRAYARSRFNVPGEIGVEGRPGSEIESPTDAIVRVTHTAICGPNLWFYRGDSDRDPGPPVSREPTEVVEDVGDDVTPVEPGDRELTTGVRTETVDLDGVAEGYRVTDEREAIEVFVRP